MLAVLGRFPEVLGNLGYEWPTLCGQCAEDKDFNSKVQTTVMIASGKQTRDFDMECVHEDFEQGFEISLNFACLRASQLKDAGCGNLSARKLREKVVSVPSPFGSGNIAGAIVEDPAQAYIQIKACNRLAATRKLKHMDHGDHLLQGQTTKVQATTLNKLKKKLPTRIRDSTTKNQRVKGSACQLDDGASVFSGASGRTGAASPSGINVNMGGAMMSKDMARYEELAARCDAAEIIGGRALGVDMYAARRFKVKVSDRAVFLKTNMLIRKCELVEMLTFPAYGEMASDSGAALLAESHAYKFEYPPTWCQLVVHALSCTP